MKCCTRRLMVIFLGAVTGLLLGVAVTMAAPHTKAAIMTTLTPPPAQSAPQLLVLLTIYDPWRMVIGSDEPTFVLYDTGLVIYQRIGPADGMEFASVVLPADELKALRATLKIDKELYTLKADPDAVGKTDQPTNVIRLWEAELGEKVISIYGDLWHDAEARQLAAPKRLIDLFDTLVNFSHPRAERWLPAQFEVILWPYAYSDPTDWPQDWPGFDDPTTVKRDSVYSLYLDISQYERFLQLASQASAFKLDGQTWAFSLRFPFPHERSAG